MFRLIAVATLVAIVVAALWSASEPLVAWATTQQRALQGELAAALRAVRSGDYAAVATMVGLCGLYGVVHAVGPGHGKMLIGGAAIATRRTARRMAGLGLAASFAQGLTAIVLAYGGLGFVVLASRTLIDVSETWLTAASYAAIGLVGAWLFWRGARQAVRLAQTSRRTHHHREGGCGAGCRHAPTAREADAVESWRDALALIVSIGMRPCSGALIVLTLSWRFELYAVGAASVFAMALGTGMVVAIVALAAVRLREAGGLAEASPLGQWSFATAQLCVGAAILLVGGSLAASALEQDRRPHPLTRSARDALPGSELNCESPIIGRPALYENGCARPTNTLSAG